MTDDDADVVLRAGLAEAQRECVQIQLWLSERETHPFGGDSKSMDRALGSLLNEAWTLSRRARSELRAGKLSDAWATYAELQRHLPSLSTELLALIGGTYLMRNNLDDMRPRYDKDDELIGPDQPISFSEVARGLLNDLSSRAGKLNGSLLIVGEERQGPVPATIIRLRFPSCDLWNLPFIAHEYGYLVAQKDPPDAFRSMRDEVRRLVDPGTHGGDPPDAACYLPEVQRLWHQNLDPDLADPSGATDTGPLRELADRQVAHLCRLFADAFATYFAGPAYVYALLRLRFRPDPSLTEPGATLPSFVQRFFFAYETLRLLDTTEELYNEPPLSDIFAGETPFQNETNRTTGLYNEWRIALAGAGLAEDVQEQDRIYESARASLQPWLDQVWTALRNRDWLGRRAVPHVYWDWADALELRDHLSAPPKLKLQHWAVVNAAWLARIKEGENAVQPIEVEALRLLDAKQPRQGANAPEPADPGPGPSQADVNLVRRALARTPNTLRFFDSDTANTPVGGRLGERTSIIEALAGNVPATDAYARLTDPGRS
ncbi:hypothetical protein AB0M02_35645 [Actinoplanes sp. NPDC051861]|uniref:hypothetical protein n=1 Tax=Actinoplanes sp. NPDC051861 TaxID=3155170 RepID=UPI003418595A